MGQKLAMPGMGPNFDWRIHGLIILRLTGAIEGLPRDVLVKPVTSLLIRNRAGTLLPTGDGKSLDWYR